MKTLTSLLLVAYAMLAGGCARYDRLALAAKIEGDSRGWNLNLGPLPPEVRGALQKRFVLGDDPRAAITADRAKFDASCTVAEGFSPFLFLRAKQFDRYWIVQYEGGGRSHYAGAVVFGSAPDGSVILIDDVTMQLDQQTTGHLVAALRERK